MSGSVRSNVVGSLLCIVLLCSGVAGLSGCQSLSVPRVVKIGLVGSFEGLYRGAGYETLYAVKVAVAEWNANGGPGGHPVELVALDDSGVPEQARRQPRELAVDPDVMGVIGHALGTVTDAALSEYDTRGLPLVVPVSLMRDSGSDWVFSVAAGYWQEIDAALRQAGVAHGEQVVVLACEDSWLASGADALEAWQVVTWNVNQGETSALAGAKAVVLAGTAADAAEWMAQFPETCHAVLVGGSELQADVFAALDETDFSVWSGETAIVADGARWNRFREKYAALAGSEPGVAGALAYDAANVLLAAMEQAAQSGQLSREAVARALRQTDWDGLSGPIAFGSDGSRTGVQVTASRIVLPGS